MNVEMKAEMIPGASNTNGSVYTRIFRALLIMLVLLISMYAASLQVSASVMPSGGCGDYGDNVTYTFDSKTGLLKLSGSGYMDSHSDDEFYFSPFHGESSISEIVIGSGIENVGRCMFSACKGVTAVTIPKTVKSIEYAAFRSCTGLQKVNYTGSREDWEKIVISDDNEYLTGAEFFFDYVPPHVHTVVTDKAVPATFKKAGKTTGSHCSGCGAVLTAQKTIPKLGSPKLSKLKSGRRSFTAIWKKKAKVDGYEIRYSLKKNMSKAKRVAVKKQSAQKKIVKKLKTRKKYYVQIRAYKKINGKKVCSAWSKKKAITVK